MTARKPVKVRFVENSYGIKAGEVREVDGQRADELIAARLAETVKP